MNKKLLLDGFGWGAGLWFIGYVLGIIAFMMVPANLIGWVVSPIGILITLWVLIKKVSGPDIIYYLKIDLSSDSQVKWFVNYNLVNKLEDIEIEGKWLSSSWFGGGDSGKCVAPQNMSYKIRMYKH